MEKCEDLISEYFNFAKCVIEYTLSFIRSCSIENEGQAEVVSKIKRFPGFVLAFRI